MEKVLVLGRDKEIKNIEKTINTLMNNRSSFMFLEGQLGLGKSTLLDYGISYFKDQYIEGCIYKYQCLISMGEEEKFKPWTNIVAQSISTPERSEPKKSGVLKSLFGDKKKMLEAAKVVCSAVPGLDVMSAGLKIGGIIAGNSDSSDEAEEKLKMYSESPTEFYSEFIISLAKEKPTLIVLDDIQWIDSSSIDVLNAVLMKVVEMDGELDLCILGAFRTSDTSGKGDGREAMNKLIDTLGKRYGANDLITKVNLPPLDNKSITSILTQQLNEISSLSEKAIKWVLYKSSGSPFFVKRFVQKLQDEEIIYLEEGLYKFPDNLLSDGPDYEYKGRLLELEQSGYTDSIENLYSQGLEDLCEEDLNILKYACVQGMTFGSNYLAKSLSVPEEAIFEKLYSLSKLNYIKSIGEGYAGIDNQQLFCFTSEALFRGVEKLLFTIQRNLVLKKLAQGISSELVKLFKAEEASNSQVGETELSTDSSLFYERIHEATEQVVKYYELAYIPLDALSSYLRYGEYLLEDYYHENDDRELLKRQSKLFIICEKIDELLISCKKSKFLDAELTGALVLESRAYRLKGRLLVLIGNYTDGLLNLTNAGNSITWVQGNEELKFSILILDKVNAYLGAGMYKKARAHYPYILSHLRSILSHNIVESRKVFSFIMDVIGGDLDDEIVQIEMMQELWLITEKHSDPYFYVEMQRLKLEDCLLEQSKSCISYIRNKLNSKFTHEYRNTFSNGFINAFKFVLAHLNESNNLGSFSLNTDQTMNTGILETLSEYLLTIEIIYDCLNDVDYLLENDVFELKINCTLYLNNTREVWLNFIEIIEENIDDLSLVDEGEEIIAGSKQYLNNNGMLSNGYISTKIEEIFTEQCPEYLAVEWAVLLSNSFETTEDNSTSEKWMEKAKEIFNEHGESENTILMLYSYASYKNYGNDLSAPLAKHEIELIAEAKDIIDDAKSRNNDFDLNPALLFSVGSSVYFNISQEDGFNMIIDGLNNSLSNKNYKEFIDNYAAIEPYIKDSADLIKFSSLKEIYKAAKKEVNNPEGRNLDDFGFLEKEYLARLYVKQAELLMEEQSSLFLEDEEGHCYKEVVSRSIELLKIAIGHLEDLPNGSTYLDDVYEKIADYYMTALMKELDKGEFVVEYEESWKEALDKAIQINEKLGDVARVAELNEQYIKGYRKNCLDEEDLWIERFKYQVKIFLKNENAWELKSILGDVLPEFDDLEFIFDEDGSFAEEELDYSDVYDSLPIKDLKQLVFDISEIYKPYGHDEFINKANIALSIYEARINEGVGVIE